ncbi:hypothetical protein BDN71DRAFT_1427506 [Pleurotus eryngii]|uniref:Uncharacterized protein n=1 Tax=Pleurotus eryngii TaxID=5323 RepID=A0A9P6AAK6_PLEER|nr:hypothetical protein BDN71DRAFT_1427506 [Pleurotus eryngii]
MFRSAATKLAHNSTIPALAGNKELRPLQDLITAEKGCMVSLQNLSGEFGKAAEALRVWGAGEGDDLGVHKHDVQDTLTSCTTLLIAVSNSIATYASAHNVIRASMKSIRSAEETLDESKRRRKALYVKAESAERKLSKMSPENKSLQVQTDLLNRLREEIRLVEGEILEGESRLGDDKRHSVRLWMGVKWTGLGELCEKGLIAAEYGRSIIAEIPEASTPPGMPRIAYYGHPRTQTLVADAQRGMEGVGAPGSNFSRSSVTRDEGRSSTQLPPLPPLGDSIYHQDFTQSPHATVNSLDAPRSGAGLSGTDTSYSPSVENNYNKSFNSSFGQYSGEPSSPIHHPTPHGPPQPPFSYPMPTPQANYPSGPRLDSSNVSASKFESSIEPSLGTGHFMDASDFSGIGSGYSMSNQRSNSMDDFGVNSSGPTQTNAPGGGRFATFPVKSRAAAAAPAHEEPPSEDSSMLTAWDAQKDLYGSFGGKRASMVSDVSSVGLAYDRGDVRATPPPEGQGSDRHVRFGAVSDVDEEMVKRHQQQQEEHDEATPTPPIQSPAPTISTSFSNADAPPVPPTASHQSTLRSPVGPPPAYQDDNPSQDRLPSPARDTQEEERALNAAAAREVSREFDSLTFSPPGRQNNSGSTGRDSPLSFDRAREAANAPADSSPLAAPQPGFAGRERSVSPMPQRASPVPQRRPTLDVNVNVQQPTPMSSPFAQSRASPVAATSNPLASMPLEAAAPPVSALSIPTRETSDSRSASPLSNAYRTPPEYYSPRLGSSRSTSGSVSSGSALPSPIPGTKTISAAAFRRPPPRQLSGDLLGSPPFSGGIGANTMPGLADTTPLVLKKRLPNAPQPDRNMNTPSPPPTNRDVAQQQQPSPRPPTSSGAEEYDQFDYISAYANNSGNDAGSPRADFGKLGKNGGREGDAVMHPPPGGYDRGRFATNTEGGAGLR